MTEATNTTAPAANAATAPATESKAPAPKTVAGDMPERQIFPNTDKAFEYLAASASTYSDFASVGFAGPGINFTDDGEVESIDEGIYGEDTEVMVSVLKTYVDVPGKDKKQAVAKAIVMAPIPTIDAVLSNEDARGWLVRIMHKELNHVAVRPLRTAENIMAAVAQMPTTLAGYITNQREANSGLLVAFDDHWKAVNDYLTAKIPAWKRARFKKLDLRKAFESRAFALEWYENLEDRGEDAESIIVAALKMLIAAAEKAGKDTTLLNKWLTTRDQVTAPSADEADDDSFDFDALTAELLADKPTESAPAAEPGMDRADADGNLPIG